MYLNAFNYFRAISIILIVAGHSFGLARLKINTDLEIFFVNFVKGGTYYFVFISGFLFYYVFYNHFNYKAFISKKLQFVFLPYLFLGMYPIFELVVQKTQRVNRFYKPMGEGFLHEYIIPIIKYYITGGFLTAYWYIPFIMLVFLMSPAHIKFIKVDKRLQLCVIVFLFLISLVMHRPINNINVLQSLIYYMPVYLLGIYCAINREAIYQTFKGKEFVFLAIAFAFMVLHLNSNHVGNYHKDMWQYNGVDWMLLQKIAMGMFFLVFLNRFENTKNDYINLLANTSFAIFFLHLFVLKFLENFRAEYIPKNSWLSYIAIVVVTLLLSVLAAKIIKKLLPNHSRYIIGY